MIIMTDLSEVLIKGVHGMEQLVEKRYGERVARRFLDRRKATNTIFCELLRGYLSEDNYWDVFLGDDKWPFEKDELKEMLSINMIDRIPDTLSVYRRIIGYPDAVGYYMEHVMERPTFWLVSDHIAGRNLEIEYLHPEIFNLTTNQIWSFDYSLIKSDPHFFPELIATYGLLDDEVIFIDDLPINIDAARHAGITGILFENANQLETDLRELGFLFADTVEEADKLNSYNEKA